MSSNHRKKLEVSTDSIFIEVGRKSHAGDEDKRVNPLHKAIKSRFKKEIPQHLSTPREPLFWNKYKIALPSITEFITMFGWLVAAAICSSYIVYSTASFIESRNNPTTATSYIESVPMYFPALTVCNWNAMVDCDYCNLTLKYATCVNSKIGVVEDFQFNHDSTQILQHGQLFNCLVFNNGSRSRVQASEIGYAGTITFYFRVPPVPESRDARFGLQISFHENGTVPSVFSETNYAISGYDNYYSLTKVLTKRLRPNSEDGLESVRWSSQLSIVELTEPEDDVVVISVAYSTLNLHVISEIYNNTYEGLFGQLAGMIGILSMNISLDSFKTKENSNGAMPLPIIAIEPKQPFNVPCSSGLLNVVIIKLVLRASSLAPTSSSSIPKNIKSPLGHKMKYTDTSVVKMLVSKNAYFSLFQEIFKITLERRELDKIAQSPRIVSR